jgi:MoxR-like ATPase
MADYRPGGDSAFQQQLRDTFAVVERINAALGRTVVGQQHLRRRLATALLTDGHVLLEGVPGLAKTMSIKALAGAVHGEFRRIQFTPDLLPADLVGTEVFRPQDGRFEVRKGPVFANFVLADEINRAPAKVQSALLETMQERQVTIGETTFKLPDPFFVMATQNPIEQEGTYPLPEAQIDRFLLKVRVDYPAAEEERQMLQLVTSPGYSNRNEAPVATLDDIRAAREATRGIYVDEKIRNYIVDLVRASREPESFGLKLRPLIELGASPRATIALFLVARAEALLSGEYFVSPQNVKDVALDVLRHRIVRSYEAEAQGLSSDDLVRMVLEGVQVP